jgi:hypothetical protein
VPADCTQDNAIDVIAMGHAASDGPCCERSVPHAGEHDGSGIEYWKVVCNGPQGPAPVQPLVAGCSGAAVG